MTKLNLSLTNKVIALFVTVFVSQAAYSQMDCRSTLGAHLTPFHKNVPILWAIEGTMAPGIMTSPYNNTDITKLNGGMVLGALDFTFAKNHNLYLEGGYKNWTTSDFVNDAGAGKSKHLGMRQAFYTYTNNQFKVKAGLHETKLGSFPIVDERILGVSADKTIGAFNFNLRGGTVMKNFARMGVFCSNRHLYGLISPNYTDNIGKKPGDTNLAGLAINWNPQYKKPVQSQSTTDSDEFSEFTDEFSSGSVDNKNFEFSQVQLLIYNEFGNQNFIPDHKLYLGAFADMNLPFDFVAKVGGVYQNMSNNNTVIYIANLGRILSWQNAASTRFDISYIGKVDVSQNALYMPLFSNLFLGEIMRLDATDFPLWNAKINHRFPGKLKFNIGIKAVGQITDAKTNEQDIELGISPFKNHLKVTLIGSRVQTKLTPNDFYMIRAELRLAF
ncbi:MAG: hypothetical protein PHW82_09640 [Bacteroidales bacterium]|nr:hypothetical protein [Bacteroidales bacterium]